VWEPAAGRRLTVFGIRSRETADAEFTGDTSGERAGFTSDVHNDLAAVSYFTPLGSRIGSRTIVSFYENTDRLGFDADLRDDARRSNTPGVSPPLIDVIFTRGLTVRDIALREELAARATPSHVIEAGFDVHRLRTSWQYTITGERNLGEANGSSIRGGAGLPSALDSAQNTSRAAAWIQDRWDLKRAVVEPGVRVDWSGTNGDTSISPRLAVSWPLGAGGLRARAAAGLYTQSPGYEKLLQADYFVDLTDAGRLALRSERAVHAIAGLERELGPGMLARAELFYRGYDRLIVGRLETPDETAARLAAYEFPASLAGEVPRDPLITSVPTNDGSGRAYGFDLYLAHRAAAQRRLTGWASYTYGRADIRAYGLRFPFDYDRPHALSLVGTYRVRRSLDVAATLRVASGFPTSLPIGVRVSGAADTNDRDGDGNTTEIVPQRDAAGGVVFEPDFGGAATLNRARLPVFARLDGRITWRKARWQIYLEVINLTNRENAGDLTPTLVQDPSSDRPKIEYSRDGGIPRLPSVGLRVRF
jgi:hypothetical protein